MKYIKSYILLALMVLAVTGCKQEDLKDDVNALKDRVTLLEEQVKLLNENIAFFSKVLVRQTVDNGDGTVTEVPAYSISKITLSADNTSYTAVFNDGQTLTLTIGSKGTVTTPQISVNQETGKWMLQGADTGYSAVGIDSNENGATPEFQVVKDETTQQYYWQVKFDDSTGWQDVTDASNQKVYVTEAGSELAKDQLFEEAKIEGSEFVLTYYVDGNGQGTTQEIRLPILSDLSCIINVPESEMADGYWEIGANGASAEVEIKGEHWFVVAPHGWEASISETDGKAILTVEKSATASAGLKSRATANNTDEVVVQVNKGMYWAVAKVKVREAVTSYYSQVYKAGKNIVVGEPGSENGYGLNINETEFADGQLLQNGASISDNNGVYFIEDGATVTLDAISDLQSLVIVGNNPEKPSTVKVEANSFLLGATGGKGIVMKNVILDAENATFTDRGLISTTSGSVSTRFEHLIFDGCEIRMLTDKRLVYLDSRTDNLISTIVYFALYNTKVELPISSQPIDMFFIYKHDQKTFEGCEMVVYKNNVFYSAEEGKALINFALLQANTSLGEFNKVIVQNNTLVNLLAKNILVRAKMKNLSVTNNLLWNNFNDTETTRCIIGLMPGSNTASILYGDNKAYDPSTDAKKWIVFNKRDDLYVYPDQIEGGNNLPIEAVDPFATEGGSMNWDAGIFVPGAGYENIGAHIN